MMKSLERLISCMVAELSDHVNMSDATFLDAIKVFDGRAELILRNGNRSDFWSDLALYNEARSKFLSERLEHTGFTI
jgi:hypothetical protein